MAGSFLILRVSTNSLNREAYMPRVVAIVDDPVPGIRPQDTGKDLS